MEVIIKDRVNPQGEYFELYLKNTYYFEEGNMVYATFILRDKEILIEEDLTQIKLGERAYEISFSKDYDYINLEIFECKDLFSKQLETVASVRQDIKKGKSPRTYPEMERLTEKQIKFVGKLVNKLLAYGEK